MKVRKVENNDSTIERKQMEMRNITSVELVKEMVVGWNLGNTLDATGSSGLNTEIGWGNPITTKEMIDKLKETGFNILRVPTTQESYLGPAPDYIIDTAWLNRVNEVVEYGIENEMYVILNLHHEEWHFPSIDNYEKAKEVGIPCIWWDNGAFQGSGENFGLLNRRGLTWEFPEIVNTLLEGVK